MMENFKTSLASINANIKKKSSDWFLYFAAVTVSLITLGTGSVFSWTSPVLPKLKSNDTNINPLGYPISPGQESLISSSLCLGALLSPFIASQCADRIGRKRSLLLFTAPMLISYVTLAFTQLVEFYYVARFLLGIGEGCILSVLPMYVGEIATKSNRALLLGSFTEIFITLGELVSVTLGLFFSIKTMCLVLTLPFILFIVIFLIFIPESPYYNLINQKEEKAKVSLKKLRRTSDVHQELQEMGDYVKESMEMNRSFRDLFKSPVLIRAMVISIGLMFCQIMCGIAVIIYYTEDIFIAANSSIPSNISPVIISIAKLSFTAISSSIIEKFGRRILLRLSLGGMCVCLTVLGTYFYFLETGGADAVKHISYLPLASLIVYIFWFAFGAGPLTWTMVGELFPPDVKAAAGPIPIFSNNFCSYVTSFLFPYFKEWFGMAWTMWFFAVMCVLSVGFVWRYVPETKGRTLQEIQQDLET